MTIKWVKVDPLVMNGEPFCFGTRLTVRNILEMRDNGLTPDEILAQHPELKLVGVAEAFRYAGDNKAQYGDFFETNGTLRGPGFSADDAAALPEHLRTLTGVVVR